MLAKLLGIFRSSPKEPLREVIDPVLGACVPDQEERWWRASAQVSGRKIAFTLGGHVEPDPALLAHARKILGELEAFEWRVAEFLKKEAASLKDSNVRAEVEGLTIDDVCLFWPDRPNDAMIYFAGPSEERVWRCDYIEGRCQSLGCDT